MSWIKDHGKKITLTVSAYNPRIKHEDGSVEGRAVFCTFCTDVLDEEGNTLGDVGGGTGYVVVSVCGREEGYWLIPHDELWRAFMAALTVENP